MKGVFSIKAKLKEDTFVYVTHFIKWLQDFIINNKILITKTPYTQIK